MKRVLFTIAILFSCSLGFSQNLQKALDNSDKQIQDPKKKDLPKTWISRGDVFQEIASEPSKGLVNGLDKTSFEIISMAFGKELERRTETIEGEAFTVIVYDNKKVYIDKDNIVAFWDIDKYLVEDAAEKSYDAYMKAASLNQGKDTKKLVTSLKDLSNLARTQGSNELQKSNYNGALKYFDLSLKCSSHELVGVVDTIIYYYVGAISSELKDFAGSEKALKKAIDLGYTNNGDAYSRLAAALGEQNKSDEGIKYLEEGILKYPENQELLIAIINLYISQGKNPREILPLLHKAQEAQADNPSLYLAEAQLYEKIDDFDKAEELYQKSTTIDPNYFYGYYALGILRFNTAVKYQDQAGQLDLKAPQSEFDALVKKSDGYFESALIPFLKAHELNSKDKSVLQGLKDIYLKFKNKSPEYAKKSEEFTALFEAED